MVRKFVVTKIPSQKTLVDTPPKFGAFKEETDDLLLELIEVTKKLKPGVQTVFIKKPKPKPVEKTPEKPPVKKDTPSKPKESQSSKSEEETEGGDDISFEDSKGSRKSRSSGGSEGTGESDDFAESGDSEGSGSLDSLAESVSVSKKKASSPSSSASEKSTKKEEAPKPVDPYAGMTPEEREREEKKEYLFRWVIIRKKYPSKKFPEFTEHDDIQDIKSAYERTLMELRVDDSYGKYRTYLIGSFFVIEYLLSLITDEIRGFCAFQTQAEIMETYDSLLVELGEKTQDSWFSKLPVEIRLFGYICFHAVLFVVSNYMAKRGGSSITQLIYTALGIKKVPVTEPVRTAPQQAPQTTMKGPSVTAEQLRQMQKPKTN